MKHKEEVIEIDVKEIFYLLLHRIWIILLIGVLGGVATWGFSTYFMEPMYTSTTMVYVINRQEENRTTYSDLQMGSQLTKDFSILVKSRPVTEKVIQELGIDISYEKLSEMIEVNNPEGTRFLEITVAYPDPAIAKELVDAIAKVSSEQMVSVMEMEKVNVLEAGNLPTKPSSPQITKNTIIGATGGLFVSAFFIIVLHFMNDTIRTSEDIEKYLEITTLGIIPLQETVSKPKKVKEIKESNMILES